MPDGYLGNALRLHIDDAGTWRELARTRSDEVSIESDTIDVTSKDSGQWKHLLTGHRRATLTCTAVFGNVAAQRLMHVLHQNATAGRFRLSDGGTTELTISGLIKDLKRSGAHDGFEEFSLTIESRGVPEELQTTVATPVITLNGADASVTCATSGATIRYTTNGSTPTGSSAIYSTPVTLTNGQTIKAIGQKAGLLDSAVASATYSGATLVAVVAMDGSANLPPYQDTLSGLAQLTIGNWPNAAPTNQPDAVFAKVPGTSRVMAFVGSGLNANAAATARIISDTSGIAGWTTQAADSAYFFSENAVVLPSSGTTFAYLFDDQLIKVTAAGSPPTPVSLVRSTDGGANFANPGGSGFSSGWATGLSPSCRVHARGLFIAVYQSPAGGGTNGGCNVSLDGGATWTTSTCPGTVCAIERDSTNGVFIALSKTNSTGSYSQTITVYTSTAVNGAWTARQSIVAADTMVGTDCGNLRLVGSAAYVLIRLATGGWTLYRAPTGAWQIASPLIQVYQPGGSAAIASISTPKLFNDGMLKFILSGQKHESTTGSSWAASGSPITNTAGQMAAV